MTRSDSCHRWIIPIPIELVLLRGWKRSHALFLLCAMAVVSSPAQTFTTLVNFGTGGIAGTNPAFMALVQGRNGNLYGTTAGGGVCSDCGTVFKITPSGALTTLHMFGAKPGYQPDAGLVLNIDGYFWGTTLYSAGGWGTVFKLTPGGALTTVINLQFSQAAEPSAPLELATDGTFYSTTLTGGPNGGFGTVFNITPTGVLATLFNNFGADQPYAGVIEGTDGSFYGTTVAHYTNTPRGGTIFKLTPSGTLTTLHTFKVAQPNSRLIQAADGNFYGTTVTGGANGYGMVYKITPSGGLKGLYSFCAQNGCTDGASPIAGLVQGTDGNFYGTTALGGSSNGTIFKITPSGILTTLHTFDFLDGSAPRGALLQATNGKFYGTTSFGGACGIGAGCGVAFSLDVGLSPFVAFVNGSAKVGQTVEILGQGFTGTKSVLFNGLSASFAVQSATYLTAIVPSGASSGFVTVTTPNGTLTSNKKFRVMP